MRPYCTGNAQEYCRKKSLIFVTQSSSGKLVRRRSYSHPPCSVCPAWWSVLAPRGSLPASMAHTRCRDLQCLLVAGQSSNLFLSVAAHFGEGGRLLLSGMSDTPIRVYGNVTEAAKALPEKVHSLSVLMRPAHKQTHHLHYLSMRRLINMCIKHKAARRCTNSMLSLHPR